MGRVASPYLLSATIANRERPQQFFVFALTELQRRHPTTVGGLDLERYYGLSVMPCSAYKIVGNHTNKDHVFRKT
jgi:hypothetical protein